MIGSAVSSVIIPAAIADAGASTPSAGFSNSSPRRSATKIPAMAYYRAACSFFVWLEQHDIGELADIEPMHVSLYIETLQTTAAKPTVKQHLAAIRMLFDWLVVGQILATNPAHSVRGPKHVVRRGKTPVLTAEEARQLLDSIDTTTLVGLRDRAVMAVMTFAFARIGAVVAMRVEDYYPEGKRWWVRLHEKGGKRHEMPAHHKLEAYIDEYLAAAGIRDEAKGPLFRSAIGKTGVLTATPMNRVDAYRMVRRRATEAGFKVKIGCHVFRATGITAYLEAGGTLENAQAMAAARNTAAAELLADPASAAQRRICGRRRHDSSASWSAHRSCGSPSGRGGLWLRRGYRRRRILTTPMDRVDAYRMIRRRAEAVQAEARLPRLSRDRHHRLSRSRRRSKTRRRWPRTKARARRSFTTARATRSRSTRSSGSPSDPGAHQMAGTPRAPIRLSLKNQQEQAHRA